jgi:glycosyltransferase involved in cell wall biosynthesis
MKSHQDELILSIIIPFYNTANYLNRCLDSVTNQSLVNYEIILINDQSTDKSESIVNKYQEKYSNIICLKTPKKSMAGGARNIGLEHAKGKYIGFVDSDDWIDSYFYEHSVQIMDKSNAEIGVCGIVKEYDDHQRPFYKYNYKSDNTIDGIFALELLVKRLNLDISISPVVCNKIYRRDFLAGINIKFLEDNSNEDDVFNYLCFLNCKKVSLISEVYYHYYQRNNSITHSFTKKHIDDFIIAFKEIKGYLDRHNLFIMHRDHYYAFFEKCLSFVLNLMLDMEKDTTVQNKIINYLIQESNEFLPLVDYIDYCGAKRIRYFLHPDPIK